MIKAVLLDLDNILDHSRDRAFAHEFFQLLDEFFERFLSTRDVSAIFRNSLQLAASGPVVDKPISAQLSEHISQTTNKPLETVLHAFSVFYQDVFPALKNCIQLLPDVLSIVESIYSQELLLVIATNPLYPEAAIRERLSWTGLPNTRSDYAFIANAQNMHFVKPHPAYYAEVVARVGIEPDEAVMVGGSLSHDIIPASSIGIQSFLVTHASNPGNLVTSASYRKGTLRDFLDLLYSSHLQTQFTPIPKQPQMIEPQLIGNVAALYGMVENIPANYWDQHPDPDEWSPRQVVCHLAESEDVVQRPRLQQIKTENNPFLTSPKTPPGPAQYRCTEPSPVYIERFVQSRKQTISFLRELSPDEWYRSARHSIFGPTNLLEMAYFTAQHDRLHLKQLCQTLGKCE